MTEGTTKVVFFFPWKEVSGGPIYLTRLADELAKSDDYEVYYTDYEDSLSDTLLTNEKVRKIVVSVNDFSVKIKEPVVFITPIYFACWIPELHPDSKIVFINWHMCCIPSLYSNWRISEREMSQFLKLVRDTSSVFFCDESHRLGQNTATIEFAKDIVPISLPDKIVKARETLISDNEYNVAVVGRLVIDKIYSITNLLDNIEKSEIDQIVNVHIIGDGPEKRLIDNKKYKKSKLKFLGTLNSAELDVYLSDNVDILFAMGTSALEGGALSLPSVIIPHNMHPIYCDSYVYLQDTQGYCLGWYENQFDELLLKPVRLQKIFDDVYRNKMKAELGAKAYSYYLDSHKIESTVKPFKKIIDNTSLTFRALNDCSNKFIPVIKEIKFGRHTVACFYRDKRNFVVLKLFDRLNFLCLKPTSETQWKRLYFLGIPWLEISRINRKFHFRFADRKQDKINLQFQQLNVSLQNIRNELLSEIKPASESHVTLSDDGLKSFISTVEKNTNSSITITDSMSKHANKQEISLSKIDDHLDRIETSLAKLDQYNDKIVQMDTCDKLLSEESFNYFCGDIKDEYLSLISGLDDTSLRTVNRILSRIQQYRMHKTSYFRFTEEESKALRHIEDSHVSNIVYLNEEFFAYGRYIIPINLITTTVFYYKYFTEQLKTLNVVKEKAIIDVGGSFGDSALIFSAETNAEVHVFEPTTKMFELASKTMKENSISNVVLNKQALGAKNETLTIRLDDDFSTISEQSVIDNYESEQIDVTTLDHYVENNNIEVGLIKVDIEGFEMQFLQGAEKTIRQHRPVLIISIYHSAHDFFNIKKIIESYDLGYQFKIRKPSDQSIIVDTMLIAEVI